MAHNRSPSKIRADALAVPLGVYCGWWLEIDCAGPCKNGRTYRVEALAEEYGGASIGEVLNRFRCAICRAGPVRVELVEMVERRRVPLRAPGCNY